MPPFLDLSQSCFQTISRELHSQGQRETSRIPFADLTLLDVQLADSIDARQIVNIMKFPVMIKLCKNESLRGGNLLETNHRSLPVYLCALISHRNWHVKKREHVGEWESRHSL